MKKLLLFFVLVIALTTALAGCASKAHEAKTDEEMITDTMTGFLDAVNNGEVEKASKFFASANQMSQQDEAAFIPVVEAWCSTARAGKIRLKSVDDVSVTGSMATANIVIAIRDAQAPPQEYEFVRVDDAWKITSTIPCSSR